MTGRYEVALYILGYEKLAAGSTGTRLASMAASSDRLFKLDGPEAMWVTLLGAP